ncbi:MAG: kelch repeat-containing protein, partial [Gammaproteobacteria bacterium]
AAAFAMNHFIYMLGGHDGRNRLRSVEMAPLDQQGRVGPWSFTTPLHDERSATALAVHGDKVYVFGGMGTGGALSSVEMAEQGPDGTLGIHEPRRQPIDSTPGRTAAPPRAGAH